MVSRNSDRFRCAAGGAGRPLSASVTWPNQFRPLLTPLPRFACTISSHTDALVCRHCVLSNLKIISFVQRESLNSRISPSLFTRTVPGRFLAGLQF